MLQALLYAVPLLMLIFFIQELIQPIDKRWSSLNRYSLPAGPTGSLAVGNLLEFWRHRSNGSMATYFLSLRRYGEMTTLHMGSSIWVLLNTNRTTDEIIGKRAKLTHERPPMPIAGDLVSRGMRSVTQPTRVWTELRRMMRPLMNNDWTRRFAEWQDLESLRLLSSYVDDPCKWYLHNSRYATGVMHGVITGDRLTKSEEEMQKYRLTTMEFLASIQSTTVDFYPWMALMPRALQFWRYRWEAIGRKHHHVFKSWWEPVKAKVDKGKADHSWVKEVLLNPQTQFKGNEEEALYLTNTVISAGGDNPRIALNTCLMASIQHPEAFMKCREEVDRICGSGADGVTPRLPTVEDVQSMPQTCAFIKECLRWRPVVPSVPPHTASEDFTFEGYSFPKGTNFVINIPSVCADYPEADAFRPERWIDEMGNEARLTQNFWGFGGGRRICIGYKTAQTALFLPFSRLIFCFDLEPRHSFDDTRVDPWSSTEPFPLQIQLRSEAHRQLIASSSSSAESRVC